jgi:prepilin-type N-terminal cleavage/methylation domain-containing protein
MHLHLPSRRRLARGGFSLIEISLVIALMLGLMSIVGMNIYAMRDWQTGKDAGLSLQAVFAAQRAYMADHPTANIATVTAAELTAYLPAGWSVMPTFESLDDETLTLDHAVMPPRLLLGETVYDPSDSPSDGLWDTDQ